MKKTFILLFIVAFSANAWAESKEKASPKKVVPFSSVNQKVSEGFCAKMEQCAKQKIPQTQCVSEMKDAFQQNYDALPSGQKIEVTPADLDLCAKSIKDSSCDQLKKAESLQGCDFIKSLNNG